MTSLLVPTRFTVLTVALISCVPWMVKQRIKGKMKSGTRTFTDAGDGRFRMNVANGPKGIRIEYTFTVGEPFEAIGPDGKPHRITFIVSGERLIERHEHMEGAMRGVTEIIEYYIQNDGYTSYIVAAAAAQGVIWKRYYKMVK